MNVESLVHTLTNRKRQRTQLKIRFAFCRTQLLNSCSDWKNENSFTPQFWNLTHGKKSRGYFLAPRGNMIHLPWAAPSLNKSHIPLLPKSNPYSVGWHECRGSVRMIVKLGSFPNVTYFSTYIDLIVFYRPPTRKISQPRVHSWHIFKIWVHS